MDSEGASGTSTAGLPIYRPLGAGVAQIEQQLKIYWQIRLFALLPGNYSEEIKGHLVHVYLNHPQFPPTYEALSYAWGDPNNTVPITVLASRQYEGVPFEVPDDDRPVVGNVQVTQNCDAALRALRTLQLPDRHRMVWIDSICINQSDLKEKSSQVMLMQDIYQGATKVTAWLGYSFPYCKWGLAALDVMFSVDFAVPLFSAYYTRGKPRLGLLSLMRRDWWKRMWAVQEIVLAKKARLLCGDQSVDWPSRDKLKSIIPKLKQLVQDTSARQNEHDTGLEVLLGILQAQARMTREPKPSLLDLVELFQLRQCTNPLDRVFALLGLAREEDVQDNQPDYTMSLGDVQIRLFEKSIPKLQGLQFLNCSDGHVEDPGRSSWILEWNSKDTKITDSGFERPPRLGFASLVSEDPYFRRFTASGDATPHASFSIGAEGLPILTLKALIVDQISVCEGQHMSCRRDNNRYVIEIQYPADDDPIPLMKRWRKLAYKRCAKAGSPYGTANGAVEEAFWRTLIADSDPDPLKAGGKADSDCEKGYHHLFENEDADGKTNASRGQDREGAAQDPSPVSTQDEDKKSPEIVAYTQFSVLALGDTGTPPSEYKVAFQRASQTQPKPTQDPADYGPTDITGLSEELRTQCKADGVRAWSLHPECNGPSPFSWAEMYPNPKQLHYYNIGLHRAAFPRRFIITNKGYMGLAPPKAQPGDLVCILLGGCTPFIIRKAKHGFHRLVGECYVHGLMDGEALGDLAAGKLKEQEITLH